MSAKRYAMVRGRRVEADTVARYLPSNYKVVWAGEYWDGVAYNVPTVVIEGIDDHDWTLDGYVLPRLGSGGMWAIEIQPDDPVMTLVR